MPPCGCSMATRSTCFHRRFRRARPQLPSCAVQLWIPSWWHQRGPLKRQRASSGSQQLSSHSGSVASSSKQSIIAAATATAAQQQRCRSVGRRTPPNEQAAAQLIAHTPYSQVAHHSQCATAAQRLSHKTPQQPQSRPVSTAGATSIAAALCPQRSSSWQSTASARGPTQQPQGHRLLMNRPPTCQHAAPQLHEAQ